MLLLMQVAAMIPNPAAPKKGRKEKDAEEVNEYAQYKQFLHELPPKMSMMMNRYASQAPCLCAKPNATTDRDPLPLSRAILNKSQVR